MVSILINFETLLGKKVIGTSGNIIGEVKGASINTKTWQVLQLQIKLSDIAAEELGLKKKFRSSTANMPVRLVQTVGDVINISLSLKEISESKEITEFKQ